MLKLLNNIRPNLVTQLRQRNIKHKQHYLSNRYLYGAILTSGSLISWCTCQSLVDKRHDDTPHNKIATIKKWLVEVYNERFLHSSVLRFGRAGVTIVSVFIDYKFSLMGIDRQSEKYSRLKSECHLRSAKKFKSLCSSNGGVFMKVGQHIGSLEFLFPPEYTDTLKCFQYEAPESSIDDVKYVIQHDTNKTMNSLFESFDEQPIGSASLAQVHKAVLKNGDIVAVKVQHRTVKDHAFADAKCIEFFAYLASKLFSEFKFQWLTDQIKANLPLELNFLNEGKNCEKMGEMLRQHKYIKVPQIYWEQSTERVLFMEYCEGSYVDDLEYISKNNLNVNEISSKLGELYSEMIFVNGFIHCDPHPGNIIIRKSRNSGKIEMVLLDHGLYQVMKNDVRLAYCKLWQKMIQADVEGIKKYSQELGVGDYYGLLACIVAGRSWDAIRSGIDKKGISSEELEEVQKSALQYVSTITEILDRLPRELILIFKTNDLLRGLDARLKTRAASTSFIAMSKCCLLAVYNEDLNTCHSFSSRLRVRCKYALDRFRLLAYQFSLSTVGSVFVNVLLTVSHIKSFFIS